MKKINIIALAAISSLIFRTHLYTKNQEKWIDKGISEESPFTKNLSSTSGDLKSQKFQDVMFQPSNLFHVKQVAGLSEYVNAIHSIETIKERWKLFDKIVTGRPAFGSDNLFTDFFADHIKDAAQVSGTNL